MRKILHFFYFTCFFFLLLAARLAYAQDPLFRSYLQDEGLINSTVYHSLQDSDGFLWFATESGAVRYNGKTYQHFTIENGLSDNEVLKIYEDSRHRIWFLTLSGRLCYYYKGSFHNSSNDAFIRKIRVNSTLLSFYEDSDHNLWFAGLDNYFLKISNKNQVSQYSFGNVTGGLESFFMEDSQKQIMLVCGEGFFKIKGDQAIRISVKHSLINSKTYYFNRKTGLLFLSAAGIIQMRDTLQKVILPAKYLQGKENLSYFYIDSRHNLWLNTLGDGVYQVPDYLKPDPGLKHYLPNKIITSANEDFEGNLWFTTVGEGAYMKPANNFNIQTLTADDGLKNNKIYAVTADKNGTIWLGFNGGILQKLLPGQPQTYDINFTKHKYNRVKDIYFDKLNNAWVATDVGLTHLQKLADTSYKAQPILKNKKYIYPAKKILQDKNGKITTVFSSGIDEVLTSPTDKGYYILCPFPNLPRLRTFTHFYDNTGSLWVSNVLGLNQLQNGRLINYGEKYPLLKNRISAIIQTPDSTIVISTFGYGILFFKNKKIIRQLRTTQGLPDNTVTKLISSGHEIWATTNKGVVKFNYRANNISGLVNYSSINGLLSNEVNDIELSKNYAYVATDKGLSIIDRKLTPRLPQPPKIQFTEVLSKNKVLDYTKPINLSSKQNALNINFIAISFLVPRYIEYQYRLKELNTAWTLTTDTYVHYPFLESGLYTFEIRARKFNSNWSKPILLQFYIAPPIWKTWWFLSLSTVLIIVLIVYIVRNLATRKLKRKLQLLETENKIQQERQRIARDLHDNVGSQLAYIINYLDDSAPTKVEFHQGHLRDFTKQTISQLRDTIWAIRQKNITVAGLEAKTEKLLQQVLMLRPAITYEIMAFGNTAEELSPSQALNLYRIIQECINNIVQHSQATRIEIVFKINALNKLSITIADNGIGFNTRSALPEDHYGILNMQHRATEIPGSLSITSEPGNGTSVMIKTQLAYSFKPQLAEEEVYL